jgi:hypothetical protein
MLSTSKKIFLSLPIAFLLSFFLLVLVLSGAMPEALGNAYFRIDVLVFFLSIIGAEDYADNGVLRAGFLILFYTFIFWLLLILLIKLTEGKR